MAAMIADLKAEDLLKEQWFSGRVSWRTPQLNAAGGRDHWPHGFSVVVGGRIRGGQVVDETNLCRISEQRTIRLMW